MIVLDRIGCDKTLCLKHVQPKIGLNIFFRLYSKQDRCHFYPTDHRALLIVTVQALIVRTVYVLK